MHALGTRSRPSPTDSPCTVATVQRKLISCTYSHAHLALYSPVEPPNCRAIGPRATVEPWPLSGGRVIFMVLLAIGGGTGNFIFFGRRPEGPRAAIQLIKHSFLPRAINRPPPKHNVKCTQPYWNKIIDSFSSKLRHHYQASGDFRNSRRKACKHGSFLQWEHFTFPRNISNWWH